MAAFARLSPCKNCRSAQPSGHSVTDQKVGGSSPSGRAEIGYRVVQGFSASERHNYDGVDDCPRQPAPVITRRGAVVLATILFSGCGGGANFGSDDVAGQKALRDATSPVWVTGRDAASLYRLEPSQGTVAATIPVGGLLNAVAVGEGAPWVANSDDNTVSRVDPQTNRVVATIDVGNNPLSITVGGGFVWTGNFSDDTVSATTRRRTNRSA